MIFPSRLPYWTRVEPTDRQLWAIGLVCVGWAQLENWMEIGTIAIGDAAVQAEFKRSPSFIERHRQWRAFVERRIIEPWRTELLAIIQATGSVKQERDRIVHGTWGRDDAQYSTPDSIEVFKWTGPKRPFDWTLTYNDIRNVARKIDGINKDYFELLLNAAGRPETFWLSDAWKRALRPGSALFIAYISATRSDTTAD